MLQNACEAGFYHVMAFAFLFEMSQIKESDYLILKIGTMGHFKNFIHNKVRHFEPKMILFDFGLFRKKMKMPSHKKFSLTCILGISYHPFYNGFDYTVQLIFQY